MKDKTLKVQTRNTYINTFAQENYFTLQAEIFDEMACGSTFKTSTLIDKLPSLKNHAPRCQREILSVVLQNLAHEHRDDNPLVTRQGQFYTIPA